MTDDETMAPRRAPIAPTDHQRKTRLKLCRVADELRLAICEIEASDGEKGEIANLAVQTLRMALRLNDGQMSNPIPMKPF